VSVRSWQRASPLPDWSPPITDSMPGRGRRAARNAMLAVASCWKVLVLPPTVQAEQCGEHRCQGEHFPQAVADEAVVGGIMDVGSRDEGIASHGFALDASLTSAAIARRMEEQGPQSRRCRHRVPLRRRQAAMRSTACVLCIAIFASTAVSAATLGKARDIKGDFGDIMCVAECIRRFPIHRLFQ
jgi:hypothetical protein